MNTINKNITITEQRIKSPKGMLLICSIVAFFSDIAAFAVLLTNSTELKFWICPLIILVLDLVFLFKNFFSNYRFSYAFNGMILHAGLLMAVCIFAVIGTGYIEKRIVFESIALYAMPAVHFVQCVAIFFDALYASRKNDFIHRVLAIVLTAVFVICAGVYSNILFTKGFFGQGFVKENRTVVYSLDQERNQYIVKGVLNGKGTNVVIPADFNGLPVGGIDCSLFSNAELSTVQLDCATDVKFENVEMLSDVNEELTILTSKEKMDAFRMALYSLTNENTGVLQLANSICPNDLEKDEVYVTFRYSLESLQIANGEIIPTWFADKGEVFDMKNHAAHISYIAHSDVTNDKDLYFCYTQRDGKIFRMSEGVDGFAQSDSLEAQIEFDKIYRISIAEDNDEKYIIGDEYRFLSTENGTLPYKLATADNIMNVLNALPKRGGFDFGWCVGEDKRVMESLTLELMRLGSENSDCLELYPTWQLRAPKITTLTADNMTKDHSALYGSDVELNSLAEAPDPSISVRYEWKKESVISNTRTHTIANIHPNDAGEYVLTATAYSDTLTSLTSSASQKINVGFQKREMSFEWLLPDDKVYSAYDKQISAKHDTSDVINEDQIDFKLSQNSVKDAKTYNITLSLTGDAAEKYYVATADCSRELTIEPYELSVSWGENKSFVYDGKENAPEASAKGLGTDGSIEIDVTGAEKNRGRYTATAKTTDKNYKLTGNTVPYEITPRPITISTWSKDSVVYNGVDQSPEVTAVKNAVLGEESIVINQMIYEGIATIVGTHEVTAYLPIDSNYEISGNAAKSFEITQKPLTVTIRNEVMTYSGHTFSGFGFNADGLEGSDKIAEVLDLQYKGDALSAVNASAEAYKIDADILENVKFGNYKVELITGTLTINKKKLDIYLEDAAKTYDGKKYDGFTYRACQGLVSTDSIDEVCTLNFTGTAVTAIRASEYYLSATAVAQAKYDNYDINIISAKLTISKASLTVTAVGGYKTYDGTSGRSDDFSVKVFGLVDGETKETLGTPNYSGAAISNKNVGEHTLTVKFNDTSATRNYDITYVSGSYKITPKDLTVTAVGGTMVYKNDVYRKFDFSVEGLVGNDSRANLGTPVYGGAAVNAKNVGTYTVTVSLPENTTTRNYSITYYDGDLEITPKPITVTAVGGSKIYDGNVGGSFGFTASGLEGGDTEAVLGQATYGGTAVSAINVGSYTLSVSLTDTRNYTITKYYDTLFNITKKRVIITPTAQAQVYSGKVVDMSVFGFTADGLVGGETKEIFGVPNYSGVAISAKNAGRYELSVMLPYDAEVKNYELEYRNGTLVINKAQLTVKAIGGGKVYDGKAGMDFDFEVSGLVNGETKDVLGAYEFGGDAVNNKNVGTHKLTVSFNTNENYNITYIDAEYVVTKRSLTVTAIATDRQYDGSKGGSFAYQMSGLVDGDSEADFKAPIYGGTAVSAVEVGAYTLTVQFSNTQISNNYDITYVADEDFVIFE